MKLKTKNGKIYDSEDLVIRGVISDEQETTVVVSRNLDQMDIYTSDNIYLTKLKKLITSNPDEWKLVDVYEGKDGITGVRVRAPKNLLSLREKTVKRELTDEQREAASNRMKELWQKNQI